MWPLSNWSSELVHGAAGNGSVSSHKAVRHHGEPLIHTESFALIFFIRATLKSQLGHCLKEPFNQKWQFCHLLAILSLQTTGRKSLVLFFFIRSGAAELKKILLKSYEFIQVYLRNRANLNHESLFKISSSYISAYSNLICHF